MSPQDLRTQLDTLSAQYERAAFIGADPISLPHAFDDPRDQEVIGLYAAVLAWGRRSIMLKKLADLVARMEYKPYEFVRGFSVSHEPRLAGFVHRTFQPHDALGLTWAVRAALHDYASLGDLFARGLPDGATDIGPAIQHFSDTLLRIDPAHPLRAKHLARPSTKSACKRLAMYARWMVRPGPVDLGLWTGVKPSQLVLPLDVHTGRQARRLGLLTRRYDDWKAVQEVTANLRALDAADPARYDYALFGLGAYDGQPLPNDYTSSPTPR